MMFIYGCGRKKKIEGSIKIEKKRRKTKCPI